MERIKSAPDSLLAALCAKADIDKYIIGAIGETSPYLTPRARAGIGAQRYLAHLTDEMRKSVREEILSATKQKLSDYLEKLSASMESAAYCIAAPKDKLEKCELDVILEI